MNELSLEARRLGQKQGGGPGFIGPVFVGFLAVESGGRLRHHQTVLFCAGPRRSKREARGNTVQVDGDRVRFPEKGRKGVSQYLGYEKGLVPEFAPVTGRDDESAAWVWVLEGRSVEQVRRQYSSFQGGLNAFPLPAKGLELVVGVSVPTLEGAGFVRVLEGSTLVSLKGGLPVRCGPGKSPVSILGTPIQDQRIRVETDWVSWNGDSCL